MLVGRKERKGEKRENEKGEFGTWERALEAAGQE
jgi:hypothetical protein